MLDVKNIKNDLMMIVLVVLKCLKNSRSLNKTEAQSSRIINQSDRQQADK
jgi:hypothetical protein